MIQQTFLDKLAISQLPINFEIVEKQAGDLPASSLYGSL
jgi:hypothetical protein